MTPLQTENLCSPPLHSSVREDYGRLRFLMTPLHFCNPPLHYPYSSVREGYGSDQHLQIILLTVGIGINLQETDFSVSLRIDINLYSLYFRVVLWIKNSAREGYRSLREVYRSVREWYRSVWEWYRSVQEGYRSVREAYGCYSHHPKCVQGQYGSRRVWYRKYGRLHGEATLGQ